jgi:hypothetical protein
VGPRGLGGPQGAGWAPGGWVDPRASLDGCGIPHPNGKNTIVETCSRVPVNNVCGLLDTKRCCVGFGTEQELQDVHCAAVH